MRGIGGHGGAIIADARARHAADRAALQHVR